MGVPWPAASVSGIRFASKRTESRAADQSQVNGVGGRDTRRRERYKWVAEDLAPATDRARWIHVRVTDQGSGSVRTNVSVPIGMVGFGLGFARRFRNIPGVGHVDDLFEAVRQGRRGTIFDVSNEGGERVEIFID